MGIRTDPGYSLFGNDCLTCWLPGFTPKKLYIGVSGVIHNDDFAPSEPPPNGVFLMEQNPFIACQWIGVTGNWTITFGITPTTSGIGIIGPSSLIGFLGSGGQCEFAFDNEQDFPNVFYDGSVIISPREREAENGPTIQGTMDLMAVETGKKVFCELIPESPTAATFRIADQRDRTRIHIKVDPTFSG